MAAIAKFSIGVLSLLGTRGAIWRTIVKQATLLNENESAKIPPKWVVETSVAFTKMYGDCASFEKSFLFLCMLSCFVTTVCQMRAPSYFSEKIWGNFSISLKMGDVATNPITGY